MITPDFLKINKVLTSSVLGGEESFYNTITEQINFYLEANSFLIKPEANRTLKIYPSSASLESDSDYPMNIIEIDARDIQNGSPATIKQMIIKQFKQNKIGANKNIDEITNSKVIVRKIKSFNNTDPTAVLIVERSAHQADFGSVDEKIIDYFSDLLSMPLSLFEANQKIKKLSQKNNTLSKMVSYHFPNTKQPLYSAAKDQSMQSIYFVMDIRNSTGLNEYIVAKGGINGITEFYKSFKEYCDNIAVAKYQSWFRRQIGDRMDYAWKKQDNKKAIFAAMDILDKIHYLRRKNNLPISIGLGIGLSQGETWPDYEINELKGDPPRIANELQEKHYGIFLDFKPHKSVIDQIEEKGWTVIPKSLVTRNKLREVWEIRKNNSKQINITQEDTIEQLKFSGRLFSDNHIHIEGADLKQIDFLELFESSAKIANRNPDIKKQIELVTGRTLESIVDNFVTSVTNNEDSGIFSFQEFLTKMFSTKVVLLSNYKLVEKFIYKTLSNYFNKYWFVRLGIVPSLPIDFPHLESRKWNAAVYTAIDNVISENKGRKIELVIETKRQHLDAAINGEEIYKNNLRFLEDIYNQGNTHLDFSISICDDATLHPLFNNKRFDNFSKYLDAVNQYKGVSVSIHMLETLPDLNLVDKNLRTVVKENPDYELQTVLDLLNKKNIIGVTFIHMCNIFSGVPTHTKARNKKDNEKVKRGLKNMQTLIKRNDRIVVCYSSNKHFKNPFLLDYPEAVELLITGKINISLGTDDPGPFKIVDITDEMEKVLDHLRKRYTEGLKLKDGSYYTAEELSYLIEFALTRNSWKLWNDFEKKWEAINPEYVNRVMNFHIKTYRKIMGYDICENIENLSDPEVRKQIIEINSENEYGL